MNEITNYGALYSRILSNASLCKVLSLRTIYIIYIYSYKYMKIQRFWNMKKKSFLWHKAEEFEVWNTYCVSIEFDSDKVL